MDALLMANGSSQTGWSVLSAVTHWFFLCRAAQEPEVDGGGIPVTAEEMSELMYKPLRGEWGERSRDEECERITAGIDQLITVGAYEQTL